MSWDVVLFNSIEKIRVWVGLWEDSDIFGLI